MQDINGKAENFGENQFNNQLMKNILKNSEINKQDVKTLAIPKRPLWKEGISAKEFERMERESFLNWRRNLAEEEEKHMNLAITPFEKNIEIWRQLWLVVEKSHVLIQIVDGRNPLFFRSPDLEIYIKDTCKTKDTILLINKSDLLGDEIRRHWADFFIENKIKYIFFSALEEAEKLEKEEDEIFKMQKSTKKDLNENLQMLNLKNIDFNQSSDEDEDEEENNFKIKNQFSKLLSKDKDEEKENNENIKKDEKNLNKSKVEKNQKKIKEEIKEENINEEIKVEIKEEEKNNDNLNLIKIEDVKKEIKALENMDIGKLEEIHAKNREIKIMDREELIDILKKHIVNKEKNPIAQCYYFGFIGYPNVGKSSVINVLMKKKRVNNI
jgi:large subunit GTPase 1